MEKLIKRGRLLVLIGLSLFSIFTYVIIDQLILHPAIEKHSQMLLNKDLTVLATSIDDLLNEKVHALTGLEKTVLQTIHPEKLQYNSEAIEAYSNQLNEPLQQLAQSHTDAYVVFLKSFFGFYHDRWFYDANLDGVPEKMNELSESYFDGNQQAKAWYYKPLNMQKPVWVGPYESQALKDTYFITYTKPLMFKQAPMMLIGMDFEFTQFRESIMNFSKETSAKVYLLDEHMDIIISPMKSNDTASITHDQTDIIFKTFIAKNPNQLKGEFQFKDETNANKIGHYLKLKNGWYLGLIADPAVLSADAKLFHVACLIIILIMTLLQTLFIFVYSNKMIQKIHKHQSELLQEHAIQCEADCQNRESSLIEALQTEELRLKTLETKLSLSKTLLSEQTYFIDELLKTLALQAVESTPIIFSSPAAQMFKQLKSTTTLNHLVHDLFSHYRSQFSDHHVTLLFSSDEDIVLNQKISYFTLLMDLLFSISFESHLAPHKNAYIKIEVERRSSLITIHYEDDGIFSNYEAWHLALSAFSEHSYNHSIDLPVQILIKVVTHLLGGEILIKEHSNRFKITLKIPPQSAM